MVPFFFAYRRGLPSTFWDHFLPFHFCLFYLSFDLVCMGSITWALIPVCISNCRFACSHTHTHMLCKFQRNTWARIFSGPN